MKVIVVGGGAAGMMCSIIAARNGANVTLIEKNEKTGKKLYITGKGRCNLTNCADFNVFMTNIVTNNKFLFSALKNFDSQACMEFFEDLGLPLKVERGNRVFPASDKSSDVIKVLNCEMNRLNVDVKLHECVKNLIISDGVITGVQTDKGDYSTDKVVLCTGGLSYPSTGSTGDGFRFAAQTGHTIINPIPSLCGLVLSKVFSANKQKLDFNSLPKIQGISLKNVSASIVDRSTGKKLFSEFGEMLFTEKGISGPIILTLSAKINRLSPESYYLCLDLKPALDEIKLDERIVRDFSTEQNKQFKNSLRGLLPSGLIPFIVRLSGIHEDKPVHSISKEERRSLSYLLKNITFSVQSLEDISSAVVTAGGVSVQDVNPKTMESKKIKNLFFAGELLDVDALTGGFNLQIAFCTAYAVGKYIQ